MCMQKANEDDAFDQLLAVMKDVQELDKEDVILLCLR